MNVADIPLLSMLRSRLGYLTERQKVVAQNVANTDTPGYAPRDLKPFSFHLQGSGPAASGGVAPARTASGHLAGQTKQASPFRSVKSIDSETTLDGNSVVLEDQMLKMTEARMNYDAAIGFYQKSMNLLRMAARPPGK